ncbi:MAG: PilZ domain-containing protein, partial [Deltaproteobacteria bacterium]|nr:PilZ domain-containing protein [Deltaproteobacteria bacterium]
MGLKKYFGLDRRSHSRYPAAVDVEFKVWDTDKQEPRTGKVQGRLTDISSIGACLQTNHMLIEGYHLLLDNDPGGKTPLAVALPSASGEDSWTIKAQVLWYNKIEGERKFQFDVGLN